MLLNGTLDSRTHAANRRRLNSLRSTLNRGNVGLIMT